MTGENLQHISDLTPFRRTSCGVALQVAPWLGGILCRCSCLIAYMSSVKLLKHVITSAPLHPCSCLSCNCLEHSRYSMAMGAAARYLKAKS